LVFQGEASDSDGQIARVEFFANGLLLGTDTNAPFEFVCNSLSVGRYNLAAVATDDQGAVAAAEITLIVLPANDDFARRQPVTSANLVLTNSNEFASIEPNEPPHAIGSGYASAWWSWTAPASGITTIKVQADTVPNQCNNRILEVYTGDSLTNLVRLASASDGNGAATVSFPAVAGTAYAIVVDSAGQPGWWNCALISKHLRTFP
jgi:hypothetical protein